MRRLALGVAVLLLLTGLRVPSCNSPTAHGRRLPGPAPGRALRRAAARGGRDAGADGRVDGSHTAVGSLLRGRGQDLAHSPRSVPTSLKAKLVVMTIGLRKSHDQEEPYGAMWRGARPTRTNFILILLPWSFATAATPARLASAAETV